MSKSNLVLSGLRAAFLLIVVFSGASALASQRTCLRVSDTSDNVKEFYLHGYDGDFVFDKVIEILEKIQSKHGDSREKQGVPMFLWYDVEQYVYGTFGSIDNGKLERVYHAEIGCDEIDKVDAYIDLRISDMGRCVSVEKRFTGFRPLKAKGNK